MYFIKKHKAACKFKLDVDSKGRNNFMSRTSLAVTFKSHSVDKIPFNRNYLILPQPCWSCDGNRIKIVEYISLKAISRCAYI